LWVSILAEAAEVLQAGWPNPQMARLRIRYQLSGIG